MHQRNLLPSHFRSYMYHDTGVWQWLIKKNNNKKQNKKTNKQKTFHNMYENYGYEIRTENLLRNLSKTSIDLTRLTQ